MNKLEIYKCVQFPSSSQAIISSMRPKTASWFAIVFGPLVAHGELVAMCNPGQRLSKDGGERLLKCPRGEAYAKP